MMGSRMGFLETRSPKGTACGDGISILQKVTTRDVGETSTRDSDDRHSLAAQT
jgi:hypothetical protein